MGGRGAYSSSGGFTSYEYEAEEDRIGGYKVIHNKEHQNKGLPEYSVRMTRKFAGKKGENTNITNLRKWNKTN